MSVVFCLLFFVHQLLAQHALQPFIRNGRMQMCSKHDPCPPGNTCLYNLMVPGVKTCFVGIVGTVLANEGLINSKHFQTPQNARAVVRLVVDLHKDGFEFCVAISSSNDVIRLQRCRTNGDCVFGERCCGPQAGGVRYCTQAQQISSQPQVHCNRNSTVDTQSIYRSRP